MDTQKCNEKQALGQLFHLLQALHHWKNLGGQTTKRLPISFKKQQQKLIELIRPPAVGLNLDTLLSNHKNNSKQFFDTTIAELKNHYFTSMVHNLQLLQSCNKITAR